VLAQSAQTELFRVPLILTPRTYALSALAVLIATVISALVVRHRVDHLDLVEVLKARE
jgi:putative ABC transport system permease protein